MGAEDLLQEAFRRALDARNCPVSVDIVRFLAEAMRSIRDGELKRAKRRPVLVSRPPKGGERAQVLEPIDPAPNAEERLAAADEESVRERKRQEVIGLFADDLAAQVIVEGIMEGTRGEDLRTLTDLDPTGYESKRRLIRRRIEKAFQGMSK
jgi:RNA polymerase sigma-70 factor (ECF subfamily)